MSNILFTIIFGIPQLFNFNVGLNDNTALPLINSNSKEYTEEKIIEPRKINDSLGVKIEAKSAIIMDRQSGRILYAKNAQDKLAMASITKIMTAIIALESKIKLDDTVIVGKNAVKIEGADVDLLSGEKVKVRDLLCGALVASGNDAAYSLAIHTSNNLELFVEKMNKKAQELKMVNTNFTNPTGLDQEGHYSTAEDLAILANYAFQNNEFFRAASSKEYDITPEDGDNRHYNSTDKLLLADYPRIKAGKTGYTDNAGFCFLGLSDDGEGNQIITVILGEDQNGEQFQETKVLIDWAYKTYSWK